MQTNFCRQKNKKDGKNPNWSSEQTKVLVDLVCDIYMYHTLFDDFSGPCGGAKVKKTWQSASILFATVSRPIIMNLRYYKLIHVYNIIYIYSLLFGFDVRNRFCLSMSTYSPTSQVSNVCNHKIM